MCEMNQFEMMESRRLMSGSANNDFMQHPWRFPHERIEFAPHSIGLTPGMVLGSTSPTSPIELTQVWSPGGWTVDYSSLPEGPAKAMNIDREIEFLMPSVGGSNRLNVFGSTSADQVSVEQVTGVDQSVSVPVILFHQDADGVWRHYFNGSPNEYPWSWEGKIDQIREQLDTYRADYQFVLENPTVEHAAEDAAYYVDAIPRLEGELTRWQGMVAALNGPLTRVRVAGLYDAYVAAGDTPITVAVDSGAGNDQISIAPNVAAKTSVLGGKGNDVLISGKQKTYLAGGAGDDRLVSRSQKGGTLDGGAGVNVYESRFSKVAIYDARSADAVTVRGTTLPMSTAVGAMNVAPDRMSDLFLTPDGLTI